MTFLISKYRSINKNTLRAFFAVTLPSGLTINDMCLHEKNGRRWVGFPARQYKDKDGSMKWMPLVGIEDKERSALFQKSVVGAIDEQVLQNE